MSIGHILKVFLITIGVLIGAVFLLLISLYLAQYIKTHIIPPCGGNKQFDPTLKYTTSFNIPGIISGLPALKGLKSLNGSIQGNADGKDSNTGKFTITFNEVYYDASRNPRPTLFPDQQYTYNIDNCELLFTLCNDECVKNNPTDYPSGNNESVTSYLSNYQITLKSPGYLLEDGSILLRGYWNAPSGIPNIPLQLTAYPSGTKYDCKDNKCVATKGGKYSTSNCNHKCSKPVIGYSCNYVIGNNQTKDELTPDSLLKSDSEPSSTGKNDYKCTQRIGHIGEPNFYLTQMQCKNKCNLISGYQCTKDINGHSLCHKTYGSIGEDGFYKTLTECKNKCNKHPTGLCPDGQQLTICPSGSYVSSVCVSPGVDINPLCNNPPIPSEISGYKCNISSDNTKKCVHSQDIPGTKDFYKNDVMCKLKCK